MSGRRGQPDPGWALDGTSFVPTPGADGSEAATLVPGGIVLSYEASTPMVSTVGNLIKLALNGALDPSFGNGGTLRLFNRVGSISPADLTVDARGRLVGVGWDGQIAVFRLRPNGGKDRTFNGGERVVVPYGGGGSVEHQVGLQSSGRIVAFGGSGLGAFKRSGPDLRGQGKGPPVRRRRQRRGAPVAVLGPRRWHPPSASLAA